MNKLISVYGSSGFIGTKYCSLFDSIKINREDNTSKSDEIIYFISTTHNYNIFTDPYKDIDTNLIKLINVLEECKKNSNTVFNFISSWFVYGMNASLDTKESDYCDPTGFYSITKRTAEQLIISYCNTFNLKYRILRLTNIIGENDKGVSAQKNALQHMFSLLKENKQINLYDNGSNIRDFMYVDDACRAINKCVVGAPLNEIINISNNEPKTIGDIVLYAKDKLNSTSKIVNIEAPHFHKVVQIKNVALNNKKLLSYGYSPSINTLQAVDLILECK